MHISHSNEFHGEALRQFVYMGVYTLSGKPRWACAMCGMYSTRKYSVEIKMLHNLINEIAEQRGMPTDNNAAVRMHFDDLRINFYDYLNLAKELKQLELEIRTVKENRNVVINAMNLCQESVKVSELLSS